MNEVKTALAAFIERALSLEPSGRFSSAFDPEWRSSCEIEQTTEDTFWKPVAQHQTLDFSGLANAAEQEIHPDIQAYYGAFWSGSLEAKSDEGPLSLIQLWNEEDFKRLIENLVGHLFVKNRARQPFTVFFATTDLDSEMFLSIDNNTGRILLEEPGKPPLREVDENLASFLNRLDASPNRPEIF